MSEIPSEVDRCCDLVMKGGITSGILYPPAICRIAEHYHFAGIGGTSAGAIAACVAAAAEYRRRTTGSVEGFEELARVPDDLGGEGQLLGLFRPDWETRRLFNFFVSFIDGRERWFPSRLIRKLRLIGKIASKSTSRTIIENGYGLCTGMADGYRRDNEVIAPLTEWLSEQIDRIAGLDMEDPHRQPLTFGDLWDAPIPRSLEETMAGREDRSIDLRAVTTCVTFGRPYELPLSSRSFAFDEEEWRRLFPEYVVDYMVEESDEIDSDHLREDGKIPLPSGARLPIVVAARMSLSFPALFTMVPLYKRDYNAEGAPLRKVWFSDGGITSNFPIHRFDSLFPRWPTLGINLMYTDGSGVPHRAGVDEELIYYPARQGPGASLWHNFAEAKDPRMHVLAFAKSIFRSAQIWHDEAYLRLPSFPQRSIEIWLRPDEGGMNLTMGRETIERLKARGDHAGRRLVEQFVDAPQDDAMSWDAHRWARYRQSMSGLAAAFNAFDRNVAQPMPGDRTLDDLLSLAPGTHPAYKPGKSQLEAMRDAHNELLDLIDTWGNFDVCDGDGEWRRPFCGPPEPPIEIGSRAPMDD